eukprot:snap_masked-scaffold_57-processed-gene-1.22-mRNA-1 protein AED:1.00 eAED:1.00 QI:0/0/0/0/1/1/5/0/725
MMSIKNTWSLLSLSFTQCKLPPVKSFILIFKYDEFISITLNENGLSEEDLVLILTEIRNLFDLWSLYIAEEKLSLSRHKIASLVKPVLKGSENLAKFILRLELEDIDAVEKMSLINIINSHPILMLFEINRDKSFQTDLLNSRLKNYIKAKLRINYDQLTILNEAQVIFMGDGRVGKTSTIRTLFGRSFKSEVNSTLVLNDIDILGINQTTYNWKILSKYDLSIERVKSCIPLKIDPIDVSNEVVYHVSNKFDFETELLSRTIANEDFIKNMKAAESYSVSKYVYFRVYDFGGQEIFSSVHHIFMNPKAVYFLVFNMTKLENEDLQRLKFWINSLVTNALDAPVMLIGTYLKKYLRKNPEDPSLSQVEKKLETFLESISFQISVLRNHGKVFFPIENSTGSHADEIKDIRNMVVKIVSGYSGVKREKSLNFQTTNSEILFLDHCREQSNILSLKEFKQKSKLCGFSDSEVRLMPEIFSTIGLICYFPDLDLEEDENFIFFAPSYLAQALGRFIRDRTFHQLAFRIPSDIFRLYRNYVDSGKISTEIFNVLLKEYTEKEKKYILELSLKSFILVRIENEADKFILPDLLPPINNKIKPTFTSDIELKFRDSLRLSHFVILINTYQSEESVTEVFLYKGFARILCETNLVFDIFLKTDKIISFSFVQGEDQNMFNTIIEKKKEMLQNKINNPFEMVDINKQTKSQVINQAKKLKVKKYFKKIFRGKM